MKYFKKISIDCYDEIIKSATEYIKVYRPDAYNRTLAATFYPLDIKEFKNHCDIDSGFLRYGIVCTMAVAYVMYDNSHSTIHVDNYPHKARINLPLLNCAGTYTVFFTGGEYNMEKNTITNTVAGHLLHSTTLRFIDKVEINEPTVILVNEPHSVIMTSHAPRITLTLGFDRDPMFLLED